jgi:hypothetical protein
MITKTEILHTIEEMESKLAQLKEAINEMDITTSESETAFSEDEGNVETMLAIMREAWNIPEDFQPTLSLEELQNALAEGLPENWASREIMRMREE